MLYLLDANILITAANTYYSISRVPEFWSWLQHQGASGQIKIPLEMYEEVLEGESTTTSYWIGLKMMRIAPPSCSMRLPNLIWCNG
ncbi:MAG: DUF4411 family protein, partial [Candidatus Sulfotelmatobacter sp.]